MTPPAQFLDLFAEGRAPVPANDDIWTVLAPDTPSQPYDGRAKFYDRLIGSRLYNRFAWGCSPASYTAFAERAVGSGTGALIDAGCGTLVSTAEVHASSGRPTILIDLSTDMLLAARDRLARTHGSLPQHLMLLQADLGDLPFRSQALGAVLCPGMLHIFEEVEAVTSELARVAASGAIVFATSLVAERWIARRYLALLHRAGEVARPRRFGELLTRLEAPGSGLQDVGAKREGSMAFVTGRVDHHMK